MGESMLEDHLLHLKANMASRTIEARRNVLTALHRYLSMGLAWATTEEIESWLANSTWSRWTKVTYLRHVRGFYHWATHTGLLDGDPTADLSRHRVPRCVPKPVTDEELRLALSSAEPWFSAVVLAAFEGLRASEIANVDRADLDEKRLHVIGKGGEPGTVPVHPFVWETFADRRGRLVTYRGQPITGRWLSSRQRRHFDRLGLPRVHLHRFRHWYGTVIQEQSGDVRVTQECLRHAHLGSTMGYTHVAGSRVADAVRDLPVPRHSEGDEGPSGVPARV